MHTAALQPDSAWVEDRALLRSNPSAVPGAKTDGAAGSRPVLPTPHRDWHQSDKPSRQDAATVLAGGPSPLVNTDRSTFPLPLNQDSGMNREGLKRLSIKCFAKCFKCHATAFLIYQRSPIYITDGLGSGLR